jgi:hypothetical protein
MIAHDPLHRSGRAELPHPAPTLGEDVQAHERIRDDKHEPVETISQDSAACGATAGGYPGCDVALPSTTRNPPLCEKRTAPGRQQTP